MPSPSLIKRLPSVRGRYRENADLSKLTWFQVGGPATILFKPADVEDLQHFLRELPQDIPVTILGAGSNVLIRSGGIEGVVIRLGSGFLDIQFYDDYSVSVGAGVLDRTLALLAQEKSLGQLEFLSGIPGTIGGALRMNAGAYGTEIKDVLRSADVIDPKGQRHKLSPKDLHFSYRHCGLPEDWIFVGAHLQGVQSDSSVIGEKIQAIMTQRNDTQPTRARTGGSTFANPPQHKAWQLIDQAGCRGLKRGGAMVSELHCNFLINTGDATADDLESLGEDVRQRVLETSGVSLEWEIRRMGNIPVL